MSHTVKTESKIKIKNDLKFMKKAAKSKDVNAKITEVDSFKLYQSTTHNKKAVSVQLEGWKYPVYFTEDGEELKDNYGGSWGSEKELDKFKNVVAAEKQKYRAEALGYKVNNYEIDDQGSVRLIVEA